MKDILKKAYFSSDKAKSYRYKLLRIWDLNKGVIAFVCFNPSSADADKDDPTIRKLISLTNSWGFGGFYVVNLFALKSPNPKVIFSHPSPIGPVNDRHIRQVIKKVDIVVCAWGNLGIKYRRRVDQVFKIISKPYCIKRNKTGVPAHPLYLGLTKKPIPFS